MTRLRAFWESIRSTYWAVPSLMAVMAIVLSVVMIQLDEALPPRLLGTLSWVYAGGPEGARAVLSIIAGSMITVAGVTFSITIVALTLASQQFGPRLLRSFLRDLGNQIVLGTFVSTFIYCLLVLRTVRGTDELTFVPHLAVTLGVMLAMWSLGVLIFFIHHVSTSIQASQIIASVAGDLDVALTRLFPEQLGQEQPASDGQDQAPALPEGFADDAVAVKAAASGYVQAIDTPRLLSLASEHDLVLRIDAEPGRFVNPGRALVSVYPTAGAGDTLEASLRQAFILGSARTPTQDVGFFVEQLVELAVRALSPGINDPGTACMCLDRLGQALCQLTSRVMPSPYRYDARGSLRVVACPTTFAAMADTAFDDIRRYGRSSVSVTTHLLDVIGDVAACVQREADRVVLARHAAQVVRDSPGTASEADRALIEQRYRAALDALQKRPDPAGADARRSPRGAATNRDPRPS